MENQSELSEWFKRMGYDDEIPNSLGNICNKPTLFIWNELMQNARPKQEVYNIRNNIIINRLRNKSLNKQDEFSYPIENIVLHLKKQALERKLNSLQSTIKEKNHVISNLSKNNRVKYIIIEKIKMKIKDHKEREYLCNNKCKMLENNIQNAEETLNFAKNLTPVELDENPSATDITETLQKCAEKLETLLREIPLHQKHNNSSKKSIRFYSAEKQSQTLSTFEKCLILSEQKHSEKLTISKRGIHSTRKGINDKENVCSDKKINKNLFGDCQERIKKSENKRESLGLLSGSCLNESNFVSKCDSVEKLFNSDGYCFNEISRCGRSVQNFSTTTIIHEHHTLRNTNLITKTPFERLYNNEFVIEQLSKLLHKQNRQIIWNTFRTLNSNLNLDITKNIISESETKERSKTITQEDISRLHYLHIQTELQILKFKAILQDLLGKILKKKKFIYSAINSSLPSEQVEDTRKLFELQLDDICLDVTVTEMKKELNSVKKIEESNNLHITLGRISQTKEDIVYKIGNIKKLINNIYDTLQSTSRTRETTIGCVQKLGPFVEDLRWSLPLTDSLCFNEIKTFEKFPLEYNRRCTYTDPRIYYRDITNEIPADTDLEGDTIHMLTNILESPFSPPETIILHILRSKMKLNALKLLPNNSMNNHNKKYSLKELQAQESYVQYALDKLNSIIFSTTANKTLSTKERMKCVMEIWMEMPLKDFISPKRSVENHDYKFYEKQYDSFYNNL